MSRRQILLAVLSIALCGCVNAQVGMFNPHPGFGKAPQQQQQQQPATAQAPAPGGVGQPQPAQPKFNPQFRAFGSNPNAQQAPTAAASEAPQHQAGSHASAPRAHAGFGSPIKGLGNPNVTPQLPAVDKRSASSTGRILPGQPVASAPPIGHAAAPGPQPQQQAPQQGADAYETEYEEDYEGGLSLPFWT